MTCDCRKGSRCLPCMERAGLTSPPLVRRVTLTLPFLDWLCLFAFFAMVVELFLGALNLIERWRR